MYKYKNTTISNIYIYKNNQRTIISPNEIIFLDYQYDYPGLELITTEPPVYNPNAEEDKLETTYVNYKTYNENNELFQTQLNSKVDTSVNTISDLKALNQSYDIINVLGYNSKGDGAGGTFIWVEGSTAIDNGGTIIAPTDTNLNGRWYRQFSGPVHAKWFGVITTGIVDCTSQIQAAIDSVIGGIVELPKGLIYISAPIKLKRGIWLKGHSTFDSVQNSGTELRLMANSNCSMIQTPSAWNTAPGIHSTHFMALTDMYINGNSSQQGDVEHDCVQFHGVFIGSFIRNICIAESMGPALTLDKMTDIQVEHIWILRAVTTGYAIEINRSMEGTLNIGGLINFNHIYIEHTLNVKGGVIFYDPTVRGRGILIQNVDVIDLQHIRFEGMVNGIGIKYTNDLRVGVIHSTTNGDILRPDESAMILILDTGIKRISVDLIQCAECQEGFHFVKKALGVASNFFPDVPVIEKLSQSSFGPYRSCNNLYTGEPGVMAPFYATNTAGVSQGDFINPMSEISQMFRWNAKQWGYVKMISGNQLAIGSNYAQPQFSGNYSPKNFISIFSYGDNRDVIELNAPIKLLPNASSEYVDEGSIYRYTGGGIDAPVYQGNSTSASGRKTICTITRTGGVPNITPKYPGEMWINYYDDSVYIAKNKGTANDWLKLGSSTSSTTIGVTANGTPNRNAAFIGETWIDRSIVPFEKYIATAIGGGLSDWTPTRAIATNTNKDPDRNARFIGEMWRNYIHSPAAVYIAGTTDSISASDDWLQLNASASATTIGVTANGTPNRNAAFIGETWIDRSIVPFEKYIATAIGGGLSDWTPTRAIATNTGIDPDRNARYIGEMWRNYSPTPNRFYVAVTTDSTSAINDWININNTSNATTVGTSANYAPNRNAKFIGEFWVDRSVIPFEKYIATAIGGGLSDWTPTRAIATNINKAPDRNARFIGEMWRNNAPTPSVLYTSITTDSVSASDDWVSIGPNFVTNNKAPDRNARFMGEMWKDSSKTPNVLYLAYNSSSISPSADWVPVGPSTTVISGSPNRNARFLGETWIDNSITPYGIYIATSVGAGVSDWYPTRAVATNTGSSPNRNARYIGELWRNYSPTPALLYVGTTTDSISASDDWSVIAPKCKTNSGPPNRGAYYIGEMWNNTAINPPGIYFATSTAGTSADFIRLATL